MAFTFGTNDLDAITVTTLSVPLGGDNSNHFLCGWFYPTSLTAGKGYWSAGNVYGSRVAVATDELQMDTDNTTDGMWETTDANITVNKWWFIAWQSATENTTVAGQWRVWVGDIDTAPTARTVVNTTARSGNYTSGTTLYIGNRGTTSQSFFGGIGWVSSLVVNGAAINCYSTIATSGAIDAAQELNIYNRWVLPMWLGQPNAEFFKQGQTAGDLSAIHVDLDRPLPLAGQLTGTTSGNPATTTIVSTATFSQSRSPRPMPRQWVIERPFTPSQRR